MHYCSRCGLALATWPSISLFCASLSGAGGLAAAAAAGALLLLLLLLSLLLLLPAGPTDC
jgi:hypothetical protein